MQPLIELIQFMKKRLKQKADTVPLFAKFQDNQANSVA
jgi:hypothetical protein